MRLCKLTVFIFLLICWCYFRFLKVADVHASPFGYFYTAKFASAEFLVMSYVGCILPTTCKTPMQNVR